MRTTAQNNPNLDTGEEIGKIPDNHPEMLECDVVMKGGITSGIVYPTAVIELAKKYRFRCVGGTSAGAISAALAAAAEYGRNSEGFSRLQDIADKLAEPGFLLKLFQPYRETRFLFDFAMRLFNGKKNKADGKKPPIIVTSVKWLLRYNIALATLRPLQYISSSLLGMAIAILCAKISGIVLSQADKHVIFPWIVVISFGGFLAMLEGALKLKNILISLEKHEHGFGLCNGRSHNNTSEAFTEWFSSQIDKLAGVTNGYALTFGDLAKSSHPITLNVITTNLSEGRPYQLPFENMHFILSRKDMERLFPEYLVDRLFKKAINISTDNKLVLPDGYYFMPDKADFPIAVAMRMSLSFPLLISAVPLYTINPEAFSSIIHGEQKHLQENELQVNWFSDGGLSSNFPIHLYDSWLPSRPTFGITLTYGDPKVKKRFQGNSNVFLPKANVNLIPTCSEVNNLLSFFGAIVDTMQNHRDNMQTAMPGFRERVVQVHLNNDEGGLNLDMGKETIQGIMKKGSQAGETLISDFRFDHHQWVRYLILMSQLDEHLSKVGEVCKGNRFDIAHLTTEMLDTKSEFPYKRANCWVSGTQTIFNEVYAFSEKFDGQSDFQYRPPRPNGTMQSHQICNAV